MDGMELNQSGPVLGADPSQSLLVVVAGLDSD